MSRCFMAATTALALALPVLACAQSTRALPPNSLRGDLTITLPPEASLNGRSARLAPGVRIRTANNMQTMSGALAGMPLTVNYTLEPITGMLQNIWVLSDAEVAQLWPQSLEEAAKWSFNPITQTWSKP